MDETNRKRKHSENQDDDPLALCLSPPNCRRLTLPNTRLPSLPSPSPPPPPLPPQPQPQHLSSPPPAQQPPLILPRFTSGPSAAATAVSAPIHQLRLRRNRSQGPRRADKSNTVVPPFPWATDRRATVHSLIHLRSLNITEINGEVQCRRCDARQVIGYDLATKFTEVAEFVLATKQDMHDRAPNAWMNPSSSNCQSCGQPGSVRPVIAAKKRSINWLFLLLGQTLGLCTLDQLKYFCKHTQNHRTGAKDRVLYLTYLNLCKQLDPTGPFDR